MPLNGGDPFFNAVGVKLSVVIAGFVGALVAGLIDKGPIWERLTSVLVGFACSIYFTPLAIPVVTRFLGVTDVDNVQNGVSFFVGMSGLVISRSLLDFVREWIARWKPKG
jgi:hypothetical protein